MTIIEMTQQHIRDNLRTQMHKVAAILAHVDGNPLPAGETEITLKTAAYLLGTRIYRHKREKQAMLEGIINVARLEK